ncbi:hypothetical protein EVB55_043 [Rhizobium phage RHph_Y68]|uniref:Uncharacterized protein n=1 Tax=Rhizobium phage RHph_Y68 TaxID=2509787 RepID=A0A7S5QXS7_9CAUD|nr:hypothetical protein PP934_gp043 [Rhizobium phage RHph_Y68]QIG67978.1 hypothetical protein EVB55_043 [Rhizobium phage RHph_Y68]
MRNIYAYTAVKSPYPEYISVNQVSNDYSITVRSPAEVYGSEGKTAMLTISRDEAFKLLKALEEALYT